MHKPSTTISCTLCFGVLLFCSSLNGQELSCTDGTAGTSYYFGNGVDTTFVEAAFSTQVLGRELLGAGIYSEEDRLKLAYNRTDGVLLDLVEAAVQDLQTTYLQAARLVLSAFPADFEDTLVSRLAEFNQELIDNSDLDRHVQQYKSDILAGNRVVVVAHSQGNFFANQAWELLDNVERLSFGLVGVANPDSTVAGNSCIEVSSTHLGAFELLACAASLPAPSFLQCDDGTPQYVTACDDLVISGLRTLYGLVDGSASFDYLPRPLPPNVVAIAGDKLSHGFVSTYLNSSSATRGEILEVLTSVESGLVDPVIIGDLDIDGVVTQLSNQAPLAGARVKVELIGGELFDAVVDSFSDVAGRYSLCVPSEQIPDDFLISAAKEGFVPTVLNIANDGSLRKTIDLQLVEANEGVVVIEVDPLVHHLGNDNFSGAINSQFQKNSEGLVYAALFSLSEEQLNAAAAQVVLYAKGLQAENPLSINGEIVGFLNSSPEDGSFGEITFPVPISVFDGEQDFQELSIESVRPFLDYDDFEFANILIELTF